MNQYETKNYPFEISLSKNSGIPKNIFIETPWIDENMFWENADSETIYSDDQLNVVKTDYYNGFKTILIETPDKYTYKSNWALDEVSEGHLLPRIQ
ncbi:hypothetical protein [Staphylococcus equorum]|uniref:hypothetical protein n=1 Tax=Staphylococcus equorum TaxID=246432 RepID=UPI0035934BD6